MDKSIINNLLSEVYNTKCNLENGGLYYNIFSSLNLAYDENKYSLFIADLLNPIGLHGQGDIFLKIFIDIINKIAKGKIKIKNNIRADVITELPMGELLTDYSKGGRIDIAICPYDLPWILFIENKIYAKDQKNQLYRYFQYNQKAIIFYLTIDGKKASAYSTNNYDFDYYCISYSHDIIEWLRKCVECVNDKPKLKETISQYYHIVKDLVGQGDADMDIIDIILKSPQNIEASFEISRLKDSIKIKLKEIFELQLIEISKELKLDFNIIKNEEEITYIYKKKSWGNYSIGISLQIENESFITGFYYGIYCGGHINEKKALSVRQNIKKIFNLESSEDPDDVISYWPYWKYFGDIYRNWEASARVWVEIVDREKPLKKLIIHKVKELLKVVESLVCLPPL